MGPNKNKFSVKVQLNNQPSKIYFHRKQSLQIDKGSRESLDNLTKQNYLSSYPIFQPQKSKYFSPFLQDNNCEESELQLKKSSFLKSFNQKLKRERKRQTKLKSSLKDVKQSGKSMSPNRIPHFREQFTHNTSNSKILSSLDENEQRSPSILVLRKTQFLDTSSFSFNQKRDYSKDSSLQLLLKEINQMRIEEKKQIERINQQKKTIEKQISNKKNKKHILDGYFTKYERGFLLPIRKKMIDRDSRVSNTTDTVETDILMRQNSIEKMVYNKKAAQRSRMDLMYNFKQIDPWQNLSLRQHNNSEDNHFLFSTVQHIA